MNTTTTRSSARLREQRQATLNVANPIQGGTQPAQSQSPTRSANKPSPAKRRKVYHKAEGPSSSKSKATSKPDNRVKGRRGHLKQMTEMPMDVLYEIFNSLEPLDLLRLSWSSKMLHFIIMGKSARFLWENAFEALYASPHAPPSCPPDLNLAQYTRLLFDKRCMECNSPHGTHVAWPHRLRVCGNCLEGERFTTLMTPYRYWLFIPMMRTFVHGKHHTYVLTSEFDEVKAKMDSLSQSSDEWTEYVKQRGEWMNARRLDEWKFAQWQREQKRDRKNELEETRVTRRNAIVAKLGELGWKEELDHLNVNQLWTLPGMRIAKPLTDKAWEALCPELIEHLEAVKELRLEREKQNRIAKRCRILSGKISSWAIGQPQSQDILPKVLDTAFSEPFKSFIFDDSDRESAFVTDKDELARVMERFTEDWNEARNQFLLSLIPESTSKRSGTRNLKGEGKATRTSVLGLATTFFQCSSRQEAVSYPRILAHDCQRPLATNGNRRDTDPEGLDVLSTGIYSRPWLSHCQDLTFDQEASDAARMIVQQCGENPDEATVERMDEIDFRLECVRCSEPKKGRCVMKWRMAIWHELDKHSGRGDEPQPTSPTKGKKVKQPTGGARWRLAIEPEDLALVYTKEESTPTVRPHFKCKACQTRFQSFAGSELEVMRTHWEHCYCHAAMADIDDRLLPSNLENSSVPEDKLLKALFEVPLDQPVKNTHAIIRIPMRKEASGDIKMA